MIRLEQPGWEEIGKRCSAGRRSLWLRINMNSGFEDRSITNEAVSSFELCAGREGDDDYIMVTPSNPQFAELLSIVLTAQYAATT